MLFDECKLKGAFVIDPEKREDQRGFFARAWCRKEFEAHGLNSDCVQVNVGYNRTGGTLRGMHFQIAPHAEAKLVRCTRGAVYDVIIDLRPDSPTYREWVGVELTADNHRMLYVPEGFAHGYQTLTADTEISYQTSQFYHAEAARGVRHNDPAFGILWPRKVELISEADRSWPDFTN